MFIRVHSWFLPLDDNHGKNDKQQALKGFEMMLILADDSDSTREFVDEHFENYEAHPDVASFIQLVTYTGKWPLTPADQAFIEGKIWDIPGTGQILAIATTADGQETGRILIDTAQPRSTEQTATFMRDQLPPRKNAETNWAAAFEVARQTDRRVWARVSQRYCGPCFLLARWLDKQHEALSKDYVFLKIDDVRELNGVAVVGMREQDYANRNDLYCR